MTILPIPNSVILSDIPFYLKFADNQYEYIVCRPKGGQTILKFCGRHIWQIPFLGNSTRVGGSGGDGVGGGDCEQVRVHSSARSDAGALSVCVTLVSHFEI